MTTLASVPERGAYTAPDGTVIIERWPTEGPLFFVSMVIALLLWMVLAVSIVGIAYAAALGLFFYFAHAAFVAHVRGSGVRVGPDQFPELHERVDTLSRRLGLSRVPEAYVVQAGGALNALATRFLRSHMVILFSDLLEACGPDDAARDMIIGHELGHIREGHLRWHWVILPARIVPFLGTALSRAREYTCDRYGRVAAGSLEGALLGLSILAAGGAHGRRVNLRAMARQQADLDTGWMTLGQWLSTHPPLAKRLAALEPSLAPEHGGGGAGAIRALLILLALLVPPTAVGWGAWKLVGSVAESTAAAAAATQASPEALEEAVGAISGFLDAELAAGRPLPVTQEELALRWSDAHPGTSPPVDPYDGLAMGYEPSADGTYILWSSGPDGAAGTADDISYEFGGY